MLIALGFLSATLAVLLLTPQMRRHAERVATRRIQSRSPLTMTEIRADRDQLRAEYALSTRKLELTVEKLKEQLASTSVELARCEDESRSIAIRSKEQAAGIAERDARIVKLTSRVAPLEEELRIKNELIEQQVEKIRQQGDMVERQARSLVESTRLASGKDSQIADLRKKTNQQTAENRTFEMAHQAMSDRVNDLGRMAARIEARRADLYDARREIMTLRETVSERRTVSKSQTRPFRDKIACLRDERDKLKEDLRSAQKEAGCLLEEIRALDTTWQMRSNPYIRLSDEVDGVAKDMDRLSSSLDRDVEAAEELLRRLLTGEAEDAENVTPLKPAEPPAAVDETGNDDKAAGDDASSGEAEAQDGRDGEIPSLADRIRALQKELAQN